MNIIALEIQSRIKIIVKLSRNPVVVSINTQLTDLVTKIAKNNIVLIIKYYSISRNTYEQLQNRADTENNLAYASLHGT
jgi:hypothetical protein